MSDRPLGPRRRALLTAWGRYIESHSTGPGIDCGAENRTVLTQQAAGEFINNPSEERFRALWDRDIIADAVMGGPDLVLNRWDESMDALGDLVRAIDEAGEYHSSWADVFNRRGSWELYGRLNPEQAPILSSECLRGLNEMGYGRVTAREEAVDAWNAFESDYSAVVGHATAGTDHEVPLAHEMSEFLIFIAENDDETIIDLLSDGTEYVPIAGWRDEAPLRNDISFQDLEDHIQGYIESKQRGGFEKEGPDDVWNKDFWESWKDEYLDHTQTTVMDRYDLLSLSAADIDPLMTDLNDRSATGLSTAVPSYMLGGASGGIMWSAFMERSRESPEEAAAVLSYLLDEDEPLGPRLDRFFTFYRTLDVTEGPMLSLATILLTFVYPDKYVFYKWSLMKEFFGTFSDHDVQQGLSADGYWKLNIALRSRILTKLQAELDDATMLDVHTLLYTWDRKYND
ncbi:hypothetical protein ACFPYI_21745 [Halomarina salina]|uniref:Uncharacterized protein n=1 Tax=Halomarina salina TaxID=1872699 RepID=A0ABD5RTZ9_9EURY|nr:hypothetical protein [Halomarina salina]